MKFIKRIKKISVLILTVAVLSSLLVIGGAKTTVYASTKPVEFYSSYNNSFDIFTYFTTYIKVNTVGSNQHVYIHAKIQDSDTWKDIQGQYLKTLDDGSQIWKVTTDFTKPNLEYSIKYEVDGQTYWESNNNSYFTINNKIGSANIAVNPGFLEDPSSYPITVSLKNLAYNKIVKVRYTEDNWITYSEKSLNYVSTNSDDSETWSTTLSVNPDIERNFHYAVSYEVNGQTYWDNNFGRNYNYINEDIESYYE